MKLKNMMFVACTVLLLIVLAAKYLLFNESGYTPAMAFTTSLKTNSSNSFRRLGTGGTDWALFAVMSKQIKKIHVHFNAGYVLVSNNSYEDKDDYAVAGLAFESVMDSKLNFAAEINLVHFPFLTKNPNAITALGGLNYLIASQFTLDAAVSFGLNRSAPELILATGTTITL